MTDLERFLQAWPLDWQSTGDDGGYFVDISESDTLHAVETEHGVRVYYDGGLVGYGRMPGVLAAVKRNMLEEVAELRQRLDAIDAALLPLNAEEQPSAARHSRP